MEELLKDKTLIIENHKIELKLQIQELPVKKIRRGKKQYKNAGVFLQDFRARYYDLAYYKEQYNNLYQSLAPLTTKLIDEENVLSNINGNICIKKENSNFYIIFSNDDIDIGPNFIDTIKTSIINNEKKKIYHAGVKLSETPITIGKMEIFHDLKTLISAPLIQYYNSKDHGESHKKDLRYAIFYLLSKDNPDIPLSILFKKLSDKFLKDMDFLSNINESEIIELKSKDFLPPKNDGIIKSLVKDVKSKLKDNDYKLYLIGYDEVTKRYEFFSNHKFDDSRLADLNNALKKELKIKNVHLFKINQDNFSCILMLAVKK